MDNASATTAKKRILIVEDDFFIRDLYSIEVSGEGFEVITAVDGQEALDKIKSSMPDLVLLDLMLPKVDGITVLKKAKSDPKTSHIPIIIVTNMEDPTKEEEARKNGASEYLLKINNTPEQIMSYVKKCLSL